LISENVNALRQTIDLAKVTVIAVTKTQPQEMIRQAAAAGLTTFGENRVQEAAGKIPSLADLSAQWHLIGHLQTNKAKQAVALFSMIQSVDSLNLAREINRHANVFGKIQDVLLQVNVASEQSKFGIDPQTVATTAAAIDELPNLRLCGLMTIAPFFEDPESARPVFQATKAIFDQLKNQLAARDYFKWLSMGMTHDYIVAVQEGSNMIRIGTGIFGARDSH
jgi:PLP dependent protein